MTRVLISGASVAGPALAYWLSRYGFDVTVVERAQAVRKGGYNIDIRGVAIDVVERMGILPRLRGERTGLRGLTFTSDTSPRRIDVPVDAFTAGEGDHNIEIDRDILCAELYALTAETVDYRFDDSIDSLHPRGSGVDVSFASGYSAEYDLVVGADGSHSLTRGLAFGPEERYDHPLGAYVSIFTVARGDCEKGWGEIDTRPGRLVGVFANREGKTRAFLAFRGAANPVARGEEESQKRFLEKTYADFGGRAPRVLTAMREAPDFYFDAMSQIRMDTWSAGRVVLLGDAAYGPSPASGQGTSLALVGAYILAGELARAGGDHDIAFPAYEALMRDFVRRNQKIAGTGLPLLLPASRRGAWLRDRFLSVSRYLRALTWLGKFVDPIAKAANAIDLPDYADTGVAAE